MGGGYKLFIGILMVCENKQLIEIFGSSSSLEIIIEKRSETLHVLTDIKKKITKYLFCFCHLLDSH